MAGFKTGMALSFGMAGLLASTSALAQGAQTETNAAVEAGEGLEEIIVTARKREETLQSVPVAVTAIGAQDLKDSLATDLNKIGELAPQVNISQGGSGTGATITIRGISSGSSDAGIDQSVAVEIDGIPISRGRILAAAMFDLAQVQVLQGPQALFFGKNSPAGVISLRSADPTGSFEGNVTAGYEFGSDLRFVEGAVSAPLTDTLGARVAFRLSEQDGWMKNVATAIPDRINPAVTVPGATHGDRSPAGHDLAGRLTLLWKPDSDFQARFKLTVNSQFRNSGFATTEPFCINGVTTPTVAGAPMPGADCKKDRQVAISAIAPEYAANLRYANGGKPYLRSDIVLASLNLEKTWGALTLASDTGYYDQSVRQMQAGDWSPYASIWSPARDAYRLLTQELRLDSDFDGPINFMAGLYFEDFARSFYNAPEIGHVFNPVSQNYASVEMDSRSSGTYFSFFGQLRWNILPTLELSGGARYSRDKKKIAIENLSVGPNFRFLLPVGTVRRSDYADDHVSPEVTLSWKPVPDHTIYAAYKAGYKGGGLSNPFLLSASTSAAALRFEPETASGFEGGYKATLFDRKLRFDIAAYRYTYNNLQVVSYNPTTINFVLQNAAAARLTGVQGSFEWLAADGLTLNGNLGINNAKYTRFPGAQCYAGQTAALGCVGGQQNLAGKRLNRAPKATFSLGADYEAEVGDWLARLGVQTSYSSSFQTAADYAPGGQQKAYWLLNAKAMFGPADKSYEFGVIGRNLTNSYYMLSSVGWSGSGNPNQYVGFFNQPREVMVQGTVRF